MEDAWSSVPLTLPCARAILSGSGAAAPRRARQRRTYVCPAGPGRRWPTLLSARGYATGAFVGAYVLDRRFRARPRLRAHYDDAIARRASGGSVLESERRAEAVAVRGRGVDPRAQTGRFLAWVHFYDPHAPYDPPPPWRERVRGAALRRQIAYADATSRA